MLYPFTTTVEGNSIIGTMIDVPGVKDKADDIELLKSRLTRATLTMFNAMIQSWKPIPRPSLMIV